MGLAGKVAGKVLGPRPGLAIVSFWGGRIEIILRILASLVTTHTQNSTFIDQIYLIP